MLTFHSGTASAVGWSVAGKSMCLRSVGSVLVMELMKSPLRELGALFGSWWEGRSLGICCKWSLDQQLWVADVGGGCC